MTLEPELPDTRECSCLSCQSERIVYAGRIIGGPEPASPGRRTLPALRSAQDLRRAQGLRVSIGIRQKNRRSTSHREREPRGGDSGRTAVEAHHLSGFGREPGRGQIRSVAA